MKQKKFHKTSIFLGVFSLCALALSVLSIMVGISSTGNVINEANVVNTGSIIGVASFVLALIAGLFWAAIQFKNN